MTAYRIRSILRHEVPTLAPDMPMRRAVAILVETKSAAAPVMTDDGRLVGILTQKDCFRPALHASYHRDWTGLVRDHMSAQVVTVDIDDEVIRVAEMFLDLPHRLFPVLDQGHVAGMIHRSDVLGLLIRMG
ncbi:MULTISPECIES: CBS domain-containing protein [unclassified Sagittula]|uniref:CBS domain-containing protein n=1 Tax=unclassified Sagittula TaxID=2624628 RepID=UPI0024C3B42C|nr:CBS domain-containing protein [Sagittula sp. MA-2]WHZ37387.1 CBS domain-containing protein [Sagittula sp. MA-2]